MASPSATQSCTLCNKQNSNYCARCKCTSYCSKTCQKADWSTHKLLCPSFSTFAISRRPSVNHYRAVLFNADEAKPRFIWLLCKWLEKDDDEDEDDGLDYEYEEDDEENYQMPMTKAIIGDDVSASHTPIQHNSRLNIPPSDTIFVTYRDTFSIDGSRLNKSVASITST